MNTVHIVEAIWDGSESCTEGKHFLGAFTKREYADEWISKNIHQKNKRGRGTCVCKKNDLKEPFDEVRVTELELFK
jgi:hypothetical protein